MGCSSSLSRPSTVSVIPPQQFPHRQLPDRKEGYILVCGLAHSGKSTLLHTIYQTLKHRGDPSNITLPLPLPPPTRSYVLYGGHYEQRHIIFVDTPCILDEPSFSYDLLSQCAQLIWCISADSSLSSHLCSLHQLALLHSSWLHARSIRYNNKLQNSLQSGSAAPAQEKLSAIVVGMNMGQRDEEIASTLSSLYSSLHLPHSPPPIHFLLFPSLCSLIADQRRIQQAVYELLQITVEDGTRSGKDAWLPTSPPPLLHGMAFPSISQSPNHPTTNGPNNGNKEQQVSPSNRQNAVLPISPSHPQLNWMASPVAPATSSTSLLSSPLPSSAAQSEQQHEQDKHNNRNSKELYINGNGERRKERHMSEQM